jgi:uroporphyrinogen-III synthase
MRILVTRSEPDARREAEELAARGHEAVIAPLLEIEFLPVVSLGLAGAQALIATSRNAIRALAVHSDKDRALELPLFAVGEATARAAKELGFAQVTIGAGTGVALAAVIREEVEAEEGALVHLAGETLAFDLKAVLEEEGYQIRQCVLYRAVPLRAFSAETEAELKAGAIDGVILLSPRTAKAFAELADRHGAVTQAKSPVCYCLSQAVADFVAPLGFQMRVAAHPREEDVLALLDSEAASS